MEPLLSLQHQATPSIHQSICARMNSSTNFVNDLRVLEVVVTDTYSARMPAGL